MWAYEKYKFAKWVEESEPKLKQLIKRNLLVKPSHHQPRETEHEGGNPCLTFSCILIFLLIHVYCIFPRPYQFSMPFQKICVTADDVIMTSQRLMELNLSDVCQQFLIVFYLMQHIKYVLRYLYLCRLRCQKYVSSFSSKSIFNDWLLTHLFKLAYSAKLHISSFKKKINNFFLNKILKSNR
jgi:hypothetical protein